MGAENGSQLDIHDYEVMVDAGIDVGSWGDGALADYVGQYSDFSDVPEEVVPFFTQVFNEITARNHDDTYGPELRREGIDLGSLQASYYACASTDRGDDSLHETIWHQSLQDAWDDKRPW